MKLNIEITQNLEGFGLAALRAHLRDVNAEMDLLRASGLKSSDTFKLLQSRAGEVVNVMKGVSRENKGLEASLPIRPVTELNNKMRDSKDALLLLIQAQKQGTPEFKKAEETYKGLINQHAQLYKITTQLRESVGGSLSINTIYSNILGKIGQSAANATGGLGSFFNVSQVFNNAVTNLTTTTATAAAGVEGMSTVVTGSMNPALLAGGIALGAMVIGVIGAIKVVDLLTDSFVKLINFIEPGATFNVLSKNFEEISGGSLKAKDNLDLFNKALGFNLDNKKVKELSNSFLLLGLDVETTAKTFDFAERNQEKLGGSIEQIIEKVRRFAVTGSGKGFEKFGANINDINDKIKENTGLTDKQVKALDNEEKARLGLIAFMQLYGNTLDQIKSKELDEADAIAKVKKEYDDTKLEIQAFLSSALAPAIKEILNITETVKDWFIEMVGGQKGIDDLKQKLSDLAINGVKYVSDFIVNALPLVEKLIKWFIEGATKAYQFGKDLYTIGDALAVVISYTTPINSLTNAVDALFGKGTSAKLFFEAIEFGASAAFMPLIALYNVIQAIGKGIREVSARYEAFNNGDYSKAFSLDLVNKNEGKGTDISPVRGDSNDVYFPNSSNVPIKKNPVSSDGSSKSKGKENKEKEKNATDELIKSINNELKVKEQEISLNEKNKFKLNDLWGEQQLLFKNSIDRLNAELEITKEIEDRIKLTDKLIELTNKLNITGRAESKGRRPDNNANEQSLRPKPQGNGRNSGVNVEVKEFELSLQQAFDLTFGNFGNMADKTETMLEKFGLMDTVVGEMVGGFSQIVNMLKSVFDVGSGVFDFITGIISLIPGGGAIGAIAKAIPGRASGGNVSSSSPYFVGEKGMELFIPNSDGSIVSNNALLQLISSQKLFDNTNKMAMSGMNGMKLQPNITVVVESEVEKTKAQKFYMNTYPEYASRQNKRRLTK